jgi:hypothetical protein
MKSKPSSAFSGFAFARVLRIGQLELIGRGVVIAV